MPIAEKLQIVFDSVYDIRDALREKDGSLGHGTIDTLGDEIRTLLPNFGYRVKVYGDVRSEEEVEVEDPDTHETSTETEYTYTNSVILDSTLIATGEYMNTDVIDGLGELDGDMVDITGGLVQIPLNTGVVLTVNPKEVYVKFRDPVVEDIVLTNWGTNGKITLDDVRKITTLSTYFRETAIETFDELKWFDGLSYTPTSGTNQADALFPFYNCTSLKSIKFPRVTGLGVGALTGCSLIESIEIPGTFTDLGDGHPQGRSYFKNTLIEELVVPDSVIQTSDEAFASMPSLKRLVWGDHLPFPRTKSDNRYAIGYLSNNPNLETIDNLPNAIATGCRVSFQNDAKLDFTDILPLVEAAVDDTWLNINTYLFDGTTIFDYAANGVVTYPNLTTNSGKLTGQNTFSNLSEMGYTISLPNCTENPNCMGDNRAGKVIFCDSVTTMDNFGKAGAVSEFILPCTTPPTLTASSPLTTGMRVYVPASSLSAYQSDSVWGTLADKYIRAYRDPANAAFCSIPAAAPIPSSYTKVEYISNIDGAAVKNCQISNIGYKPKQYSQYLLDFSHKWIEEITSTADQSCLFYTGDSSYKDFCITIDSGANDRYPALRRRTSTNTNYPNRMGMVDGQRWFFNSHVTGESFGQRSILKIAHKFMEYHGLVHQVDENTGDSNQNLSLLRYGNSETLGRQVKIYRLCIFEPAEDATDYDDPSDYEIVRDYVPVMRNSDGVFGLYERLTENFYTSTISGVNFSGPSYE